MFLDRLAELTAGLQGPPGPRGMGVRGKQGPSGPRGPVGRLFFVNCIDMLGCVVRFVWV